MASLSELMQAAEYKQQAKLAADPMHSAVDSISSGFTQGFDNAPDNMKTAYQILTLKKQLQQEEEKLKYETAVRQMAREKIFNSIGTKPKEGEGINTEQGKISQMVDDASGVELAGDVFNPRLRFTTEKSKQAKDPYDFKVVGGELVRTDKKAGTAESVYKPNKSNIKDSMGIMKRRAELINELEGASNTMRPVLMQELRKLEEMEGIAPKTQEKTQASQTSRPAEVPEAAWNAATEEQRADYLNKRKLMGR